MEFFEHFLNPFQECDADKSHGLNEAELKDCILSNKFIIRREQAFPQHPLGRHRGGGGEETHVNPRLRTAQSLRLHLPQKGAERGRRLCRKRQNHACTFY